MQMKAIMALSAGGVLVTVPVMATMNWHTTMPKAPQMSSGRRPKRSMVQKEMGVEHTLTSVVMSEMRKGFWMVPSDLKKLLPK